MKNLRKLAASVLVTVALAFSAFAGETPTGPCPLPDPGETSSPPCSSGQFTPDADETADSTESTEYLITEVTFDLVKSLLSLL